MQIGNQNVLIPTSMVGNYPNPRWWDSSPTTHRCCLYLPQAFHPHESQRSLILVGVVSSRARAEVCRARSWWSQAP